MSELINDADVSLIMDRALSLDHQRHAKGADDGLSVEQLREIAGELDVDPELIDVALLELRQSREITPSPRRLWRGVASVAVIVGAASLWMVQGSLLMGMLTLLAMFVCVGVTAGVLCFRGRQTRRGELAPRTFKANVDVPPAAIVYRFQLRLTHIREGRSRDLGQFLMKHMAMVSGKLAKDRVMSEASLGLQPLLYQTNSASDADRTCGLIEAQGGVVEVVDLMLPAAEPNLQLIHAGSG